MTLVKKSAIGCAVFSAILSQTAFAGQVVFDQYNAATYTNVEHNIVMAHSGQNYCLEINGQEGFHRAIRLEPTEYNSKQCDTQWNFESVGGNKFHIKPQGTNNCLAVEYVYQNVPDERLGAGVRTYKCNENQATQAWSIELLGNNQYLIANEAHNSCLTFGDPTGANKDLVMNSCNMGGDQQFELPDSQQVCEKAAFILNENPTSRFDGTAVRGHFDGINCIARQKPVLTRAFAGNFDYTNNEYNMTLSNSGECASGLREGDLCYLGTPPEGSYVFEWAGYLYYTP